MQSLDDRLSLEAAAMQVRNCVQRVVAHAAVQCTQEKSSQPEARHSHCVLLQTPAQYALTMPTTLQSSSLDNFRRAASFWLRAAYIYFSYKATQVRHSWCS